MDAEAGLPTGATLAVLGATGDLAVRKLYPALGDLCTRGLLPERFCLIGVARTAMSDTDFAQRVHGALDAASRGALDRPGITYHYVQGSFEEPSTFERLAAVLATCDRDHDTQGNRIFYLATVPGLFDAVVRGLGAAGLADETPGAFTRLVVEKPFGHDLASARALDALVHSEFAEHQVFRIDHYLGKETVQNILALRFANSIFEPLWNRRYVDHVQITIAEPIGVGHRGSFYERAGALRDIVQNHGMQVLSLVGMEAPVSFEADAIRDEKVKVLRSIRPLGSTDIGTKVVRGQYGAGVVDGEPVPAYVDEEGVDPHSGTETYVALEMEVCNWRWSGVPFYLRAGKRLARRVTEVVAHFAHVPYLALPQDAVDSAEPNALILRIQPDEGIHIEFGAKVPGPGFRVRTVSLGFGYREGFDEDPPEAYERLLLDVLGGDPTLFIREDEVEAAWSVVQPIIDATAEGRIPLRRYPAGSWGPAAADALLGDRGHAWRNG